MNIWSNSLILYNSRPRRRSGSSIVVVGGEEPFKARLPEGDYPLSATAPPQDLDMLMMLSLSGDPGKFLRSWYSEIFRHVSNQLQLYLEITVKFQHFGYILLT